MRCACPLGRRHVRKRVNSCRARATLCGPMVFELRVAELVMLLTAQRARGALASSMMSK